jgi:hypothetical protein
MILEAYFDYDKSMLRETNYERFTEGKALMIIVMKINVIKGN